MPGDQRVEFNQYDMRARDNILLVETGKDEYDEDDKLP